jgi:hypothetical protein
VPLLSEYERVVDEQLGREHGMLEYEGSVREAARCTDPGDERRIREAIGSDWEAVDEALRVLRRAGLSTRGLRAAHASGVDVTGAGRPNMAGALLFWSLWLWSAGLFSGKPHGRGWELDEVAALVWAAAWLCRGREQRAFAATAMTSLALLRAPVLAWALTSDSLYKAGVVGPSYTEVGHLLAPLLVLSAVQVGCVFVPLAALVRIPGVGPACAQVLLLRGCARRCAGQWALLTARERPEEIELV